jgi:AcrR family transcriptional regulator
MVANPTSTEPTAVRLSAATTRNRASLIRSAQNVLAEIGPDATVEQFVAHAEVSPTTIYNHFGSKEAMFSQALAQIWREWLEWAHDGIPVDESFDVMIDVCRKLFRAKQTHPLFSQILSKTLDNPQFVIDAVTADSLPALEAVALLGRLNKAEFEKRTRLFSYCLAGILHGVYSTHELSPSDADLSLEIALAIWGLSPDAARGMTSRPLGD